jgi:hypothetical protein
VQFHASFHDHQPKPGAGSLPHIATALKGVKEPLLVLIRDSNAAIFDDEQRLSVAEWTSSVIRRDSTCKSTGVGL